MEEQLKNIKERLNSYLSEEKKFTDEQKNKIRQAIYKERHKENKGISWINKGLSIAVICTLLGFISSFVISHLFNLEYNASSDNESQAIIHNNEAETTTYDTNSSADTAAIQREDSNSKPEDQTVLNGETTVVETSILPLPDELVKIYHNFKKEPSQELLKGLPPYKIMQLYFYANSIGDYETQYEFHIKDERYPVPTKEMFLHDIQQDPNEKENKERVINELGSVTSFTQVILDDKDHNNLEQAAISFKGSTMEEGLTFGLIKNKNGIWSVKWMPTQ